ncbi:hypothetical protein LCL89_09180 [Halobacillus yeomjeoni]|uniref:hypothetical protein n=1 Tax=Halobacillus yeomjeoni TaxID=311194 RepID=UPI001CD1F64C|nr:hypothetical protein [Halobacillus yeomjeoni]MCA0984215.1 hypothetical protein [Halobacillus yeomjeoni]
MKYTVMILTFLSFLLSGCYPGAGEGGALSSERVLKGNSNADIIELEDGKVYKHGVDWIEERNYQKGKKIGEVQKGMATKASVGAGIFRTKEKSPILIVEHNGKAKRYLLQTGE